MIPPLNQVAYKVAYTVNAYGDKTATTSTQLPCHFRNITDQVTTTSNEYINADAMAWFEPDANIVKGDVVMIDDEHWRVERLTKARKLHDNVVQFLKCDLLHYGVIS